jgi:hypothetical protein
MTYASGGQGQVYITRSVQREPLYQTDLRNSGDIAKEAVGNRHSSGEADRWAMGQGWPGGGADRPHMVAPRGVLRWRASWSLLGSSHVAPVVEFHDFLWHLGPPWMFCGYSPKLMKFISLNPRPLLVISFVPLYMFPWRFNIVVNYSQQAPPSLTFASPLAKLNLANIGSRV